MPTFAPPLSGLSLSDALKEQAEMAPVDDVVLYAYELWHPTFDAPIRVVSDMEPLTAALESDAPRNPGEEVEFMPTSIGVTRPNEASEGQKPEVSLTIENVTGFVAAALRAARDSRDLWEVIERVYLPSDTSGPHVRPVFRFTLDNISYNETTCTFTASFADPVNVQIPALTFTPEAYPGLVSQ